MDVSQAPRLGPTNLRRRLMREVASVCPRGIIASSRGAIDAVTKVARHAAAGGLPSDAQECSGDVVARVGARRVSPAGSRAGCACDVPSGVWGGGGAGAPRRARSDVAGPAQATGVHGGAAAVTGGAT